MLYCEYSEFQNKVAERNTTDGKPDVEKYLKEMSEVKKQDQQIVDFLEMFREIYFGEDNTKAELFAGELMRQHRTHQQSIVKNLFLALKIYAEKSKGWTDPRNEKAVEWADKVTKEETYFPYV